MTDDLDMGAIHKHYDIKTAIRQILQADIDMTLICHKGPNIEIAYKEILKHLTRLSGNRSNGHRIGEENYGAEKKYLGA